MKQSKEVQVEEIFVQQHPEAPGGELDLVEDNFVDNVTIRSFPRERNFSCEII